MKRLQNDIKPLVSVGGFLFVLFLLFCPSEKLTDSVVFCILPLFSGSLILLTDRKTTLRDMFSKKGIGLSASAAAFSTLFMVMLPITSFGGCSFFGMIAEKINVKFPASVMVDKAFSAVLAFFVFVDVLVSLYKLFAVFSKKRECTVISEKPLLSVRIAGIRWYALAAAAALVAVLFVADVFPGYALQDESRILFNAENGVYTEWDTIGYLLFIKGLTAFAHNGFVVTFFQVLFQTLLFNYVFSVMERYVSAKSVKAYFALNLCIFVPFIYLGIVYKDVVFSMSMLGLCTALVDAVATERITWRHCVPLMLFGAGVALFRHMGIACVAVSLLLLLITELIKKNGGIKKAVVTLIFPIICLVLVNSVIGSMILKAEKNPDYIKYTVPVYQIAAVITNGGEPTAEETEFLESMAPISVWKNAYIGNRYWADTVTRRWGRFGENVAKLEGHGAEIIKMNARLFAEYPKLYLTSFFDISSILWEIGRPIDGYEWTPVSAAEGEFAESNFWRTTANSILSPIKQVTVNSSVVRSVFWRGGIWLFAALVLAWLTLLQKRYRLLLAFAPPLFNTLMLFISIPSQDPRFFLPLMECVMLLSVISLCYTNRMEETKNAVQNPVSADGGAQHGDGAGDAVQIN